MQTTTERTTESTDVADNGTDAMRAGSASAQAKPAQAKPAQAKPEQTNWQVSSQTLRKLRELCSDPDIRDSRAGNTWRALASDIRVLQRYRRAGIYVGPTLPIAPEALKTVGEHMQETHAVSSIQRFMSSIGLAHDLLGLAKPNMHPAVTTFMRALKRRKGQRAAKKTALVQRHVQRIQSVIGNDIQEIRDLAIVLMARSSLLRRSEISALRRSQLEVMPDGSGRLLLARSKNDPEGRGSVRYVERGAVEAVAAWIRSGREILKRRGVEQWPQDPIHGGTALFCSLQSRSRAPTGRSLPTNDIARAVKRLSGKAGLDAAQFAGHSMRRGMAVDLIVGGESLAKVMDAGGWRDAASAARYFEAELAGFGAVAEFFEGIEKGDRKEGPPVDE